ncbi:MAG TPA: YncE family protein [Terriglobales bacterium]|jgi:YVTN family beta-propeller protein|nr:YncE family protein [Terriglobales bacterium]
MKLVRKNGLRFLTFSVFICLLGCAQTYRPVANPILSPGGDPGPTKGALVVDNNGGGVGATDLINIAGDTNSGTLVVGTNPVHAAIQPGNSQSYVANQGDSTVTASLTFSPGTGSTLISLAAGSQPVFLNTTQANLMFVAESGTGKVAAISTANNTVTSEISVGGTPVALAEVPNQLHLYTMLTSGNVVDLNPADFTVPGTTIPVGTSPVFAAVSTDSVFVFVVNQGSNSVSVISTPSDTVVQTIPVGPAPNFAKYDPTLRRVYVTNSGGNTVSVIDASGTIPFPAPTTVTVGNAPTSVTALADGSRAYVANSGSGTVSVINASSLTVTKTIGVGTTPLSLDSSSDSKRVIVANRDTVNSGSAIIGSISDINTATDTVITTFIPGRSNPRFVVITP